MGWDVIQGFEGMLGVIGDFWGGIEGKKQENFIEIVLILWSEENMQVSSRSMFNGWSGKGGGFAGEFGFYF